MARFSKEMADLQDQTKGRRKLHFILVQTSQSGYNAENNKTNRVIIKPEHLQLIPGKQMHCLTCNTSTLIFPVPKQLLIQILYLHYNTETKIFNCLLKDFSLGMQDRDVVLKNTKHFPA